MFAGLVSASVATALLGWEWPWCVSTALGCTVAGYMTAAAVARSVFPVPPGHTVIMPVGPASLAAAWRASLAGGVTVSALLALAVFVGGDGVAAGVALLAGIGVSVVVGCLAALL